MKDGLPGGPDPIVLWNALLGAMAEGFGLPERGRAMVGPAASAGVAEGKPVFALDTDGGRVFVQALQLPVGGLTRGALDGAALEMLPADLADAVLDLMVGHVLAAFGTEARARVLKVARAEPGQMAGEEWLRTEVDGGWGEAAVFAIAAERKVLLALAEGVVPAVAGRAIPQGVAARIPVACSLLLDGPEVRLARLRALAVGDIVLARDGFSFAAPHGRFRLRREGEVLTIGEVLMSDDLPESGATMPEEAAPEGAVLDDIGGIPVRLSFLVGERVMTLDEVQGLTRGSILPIPAPAAGSSQPVRVLANGRAIGAGHLVEVEGQPAVRISSLFGNG